MIICESCGGLKTHPHQYHGQRLLVICASCHGTGLLSLGHETAVAYHRLKQAALAQAIREGWYEDAWEGEQPGRVLKVLRLIGPAEFVMS
jgi:NADPH-dependent glutamate synthase beta subunit-like oxidoreductase